MNEDFIKQIWEKKGFSEIGPLDRFSEEMKNEDFQRNVWEKKGFNSVGSFEDFQKTLGATPSQESPEVGRLDYAKAVVNEGVLRGQLSSKLSTGIFSNAESYKNISDENINSLATLFGEMEDNSKILATETGTEDDGYIIETLEQMGSWGSEVAKSLIGSFTNMYENPGQTAAAAAAGGAAGAAASGPVSAGLASTGFLAPVAAVLSSISAGVGASSAAFAVAGGDVEGSMEAYGRFQKYAQDKNLDLKNSEDIKKMFNDQEFMEQTLVAANTKGTVTGTLEAVGGMFMPGVAGKLGAKIANKTGISKTSGYATGTLLGEGLLGGTADVTGSVAGNVRLSEDLNYDELVESFGQEFVVEMFTGGLAQGLGIAADNTVYRKSNNTANKIIEAAMTINPDTYAGEINSLVESGNLDSENGQLLVEKFNEAKTLLSKVPDTEITNKKDRRELVKNLMEREVILNKQSEIDAEISNSATDAITKKLENKKRKLGNLLKFTENKIEFLADASIKEQENIVAPGQNSLPNAVNGASMTEGEGETPSTFTSREKADEDYNTIFGDEQVDEQADEDFNTIFGEDPAQTTQESPDQEVGQTTQENTDQEVEQTVEENIDQEVEQTVEENIDQDTEQDTVFNETIDRSTVVGQEVDYGGIKGKVVETENGYGVQDADGDITEIEGGASESTNQELGLSRVVDQVKASYDPETNTLQARGKSYQLVKVNRDADGNPTSANVIDQDGKKKTFKNKKVLSTLGGPTPAPAPTATPQTEVTQITQEGQPATEVTTEATPEVDPDIEVLNKAEETLDAAAELIDQDILDNTENWGIGDPFTEEFAVTGTARQQEYTGPIGRKTNAGLMSRALTNSSPAVRRKVKKLLGDDLYNEVVDAVKVWKEASKKTTPTIRAKKKANKAIERADRVRMDALERLFPGIKANLERILKQAEKVSKVIPNIGIQIIDTPQEFSRIAHEAWGKKSLGRNAYEDHRGMFHNGQIYINLAKADATTLPHEAAHAVFRRFFRQKSPDALAMHKVVEKVLRKGNAEERRLAEELKSFIKGYGDIDDFGKADEFFAELVAKLVEAETRITLPRRKAIKIALNDLIKRFTGFTLFDETSADFRDIVDFVNTIATGMQKGIDPTDTLYNKGIIRSSGVDTTTTPRMQNDYTSFLGRLIKKYFKDSAEFKRLEGEDVITNNRKAADFSGQPMVLHKPDFKFSGEGIYLDGEKIFTGNGGVYFPLKFIEYFWASTKDGAEPLLKHLKAALEASPNDTVYMALIGSPDEKLMSNANTTREVFKLFNTGKFGIGKSKLSKAIYDNHKLLNSKNYKVDMKGVRSLEAREALILEAMHPNNTSFDSRKAFIKQFFISVGRSMSKEDQKNFKERYGENVNGDAMFRLFSELLAEPFLHGQDTNNKMYAVLELSNVTDMNVVDIGDSHGAYPYAIGYDKDAVFKLHILEDRVHVDSLGIESPRYGPWNKDKFINSKGKETTIADSILPSSAGLSTGYVTIDPPRMQNPLPAQKKKPIIEDFPRFMSALDDDGEGNYVFYHMSKERRDVIDPSKMGSNPSNITSREELSAYTYAKASMFYLDKNKAEAGTGNQRHVIKIPKEKVYPFNKDPLYLYEEARDRYHEAWGFKRAFDPNAQAAWITKIAAEHGYIMTVAAWGKGFRAQSSVPLREGINETSAEPRMQGPHTRVVGAAERDFRGIQNSKAPGARAFSDPVEYVRESADRFKRDNGFDTSDPGIITRLDKGISKEIGVLYEQAVDSPNDPETQRAYAAMAEEVKAQYEHMLGDGVIVTLFDGVGEPYKNSNELMTDLRDNQRMFVFATESGYGTEGTANSTNALLDDSGYKDSNGKPMLVNDLFRAVHDYFGHAVRGNSFGAIGEENAWDEHVRMFSPLAARAMTAETRGQNSWVNFSGANDVAKNLYKQARRLRKAASSQSETQVTKAPERGDFNSDAEFDTAVDSFINSNLITVDRAIAIALKNDPKYLKSVGEHIINLQKRFKKGEVPVRDVIKSYVITIASMQASAVKLSTAQNKAGFDIDPSFADINGKIRPESVAAAFLESDKGVAFLDRLERGEILDSDAKLLQDNVFLMGMANSKNRALFKERDGVSSLRNISEFTADLNRLAKEYGDTLSKDKKAAKGVFDKIFDFVKKLSGVGTGKVGFLGNFIGLPFGVLDAREVNGWLTGSANATESSLSDLQKELKKKILSSSKKDRVYFERIMDNIKKVGDAIKGELDLNTEGLSNLEVEYLLTYLGHHALWDAFSQTRTTHSAIYRSFDATNPSAAQGMGVDTKLAEFYKSLDPELLESGNEAKLAAVVKAEGDRLFRFAEQKMTLLPEWVSQVNETPPRMQNPRQKNYTQRDKALNNIVKAKERLFKRFETPDQFFNNFRDSFNNIGVTLSDIHHLYAGLDPNKSVQQYAEEAQKTIDNFNEVMDQAGFTPEQKAAEVALYADVAQRWAKQTGRTADEWWSDIIDKFVFAAQDSDIPSGDSVRNQADSVIKSLFDKLKSTLPFTKSRKYSNESNPKKETEPSTPLSQDKDLESTPEGNEYLRKNRNLIRGARQISDNRQAIIYISSSADVSTPVHELAHIYEMYMSNEDKAAFMEAAGKTAWDVDTSERFAIGFERFLSDGRKTSNKKMQPVFDNFRNWLRDIYNGLFKWGGEDIFLSDKMNELYSKMLSSPITNLDKFTKESKKWIKAAEKEGVKYNKETMTEMADVLGFDLVDVRTRGSLRERAARVMQAGLFGTQKVLDLAMNFLAEEASTPGLVGIGELHAMALDFEAGKLQRTALELAEEVRQDPNNIELKQNLEDVQESISIILSALSLANSKAGAVLGAASHRIRNEWFSPDEVTRRAKRENPDVTDKQLKDLRRLAKGVEEANRKVEQYKKDYAQAEMDRTVKRINKNFRRFLKIPAIKKVISDLKNSPQPLKDLERDSYKKLRDYYSTQMSSNSRSSANLLQAITLAMLNNPDINSVRDLTNHLIAQVPGINPQEVIEVLNMEYSIGKGAGKSKAAINNQVQDLKKELNLLDKLRNMIEGDRGSGATTNKTTKSQRLLKEYIRELRELAAQDTTDHNFGLLYMILDNVERVYDGDLTGLTRGADGKFTDSDIKNLLALVDQYEDTRGKDVQGKKVTLREKIADLDQFMTDLEAMRYGKDTRDSYFDILKRINERSSDQGEVSSINENEYFKLQSELTRKKALLNERAAEVSRTTAARVMTELANTPRAMILSFDYSFMTYQLGFLTMKNLMSKNFFQQMKLMKMMVTSSLTETMFNKNQANLDNVLNGIYSESTINRWKQLGLNIPERGVAASSTGGISNIEESLRTKTILESAIKWILPERFESLNPIKFMRNFNERGYVTYVSAMRIMEAERMSKGISDTKIQRDIANRVNTFTGASNQFSKDQKLNKGINAFLDQSANLLVAPRLYVSVFKSLWDLSVGTPTAALKAMLKKDPQMRKFYRKKLMSNLHILVSQGVAYTALNALVGALDGDDEDEINLDFSSAMFLKTQVGDNVVTLSPYTTYLRAGARLGTKAYYENVLREPYNTRGRRGSQTMLSAIGEEFLKYRKNPIFGSLRLLNKQEDFMGKVVEHDTATEKLVNVVLPSIAPISIQNMAKNIAEERYAEIPGGMLLDMIGINSFRRDATSTPDYVKHTKEIGFNMRINRPKKRVGREEVDILSETQYNRYKQKVRQGVSERVNAMIKEGKKPSKNFIKRLQRSVEAEVLKELTE
jgi:hypothetical protein